MNQEIRTITLTEDDLQDIGNYMFKNNLKSMKDINFKDYFFKTKLEYNKIKFLMDLSSMEDIPIKTKKPTKKQREKEWKLLKEMFKDFQ